MQKEFITSHLFNQGAAAFRKLAIGAALLFTFLGFFYGLDWGWTRGEIRSYQMYCMEKLVAGQCNAESYPLSVETYKVDVKEQEVVSWISGWFEGKSSIDRLTKCAIADRKNWSCKYDDESAEFGFQGGRFFQVDLKRSALEALEGEEFYVSRWNYLSDYWKPSNW